MNRMKLTNLINEITNESSHEDGYDLLYLLHHIRDQILRPLVDHKDDEPGRDVSLHDYLLFTLGIEL